jgi:2-methylisocitrate lyase-like PEP mutase family enzyme
MADIEQQKAKAIAFRQMHRGPKILVLPNAWDVISARIMEEAGFGAIATTSAGVAFTLGYPDGQKISREEMLARVTRIARAVKVPVTADVESGYGQRPEDAASTTLGVIEAGAVGMNLEDGTGSPASPLVDLSRQVEKIHAVREAAMKSKVLIVLNARTDVFLDKVGPEESRYDATLKRAIAFRDAGADCVFVPGLSERELINRLVKDVQCPVNILVGPGSPTVNELEGLGVARITVGSALMRATLGKVKKAVEELRNSGTYEGLADGIPYAAVNELLSR